MIMKNIKGFSLLFFVLLFSVGAKALAPTAPIFVYAYQATSTSATVAFFAPLTTNGTITSYTATASPGGNTATYTGSGSSSVTITGLTTGTTYTFTVTCTNGTVSPASAASNSLTLVTLAATNTFNGTTNTDWNTASNWSAGSVPTAVTPVAIATGKTVVINSGVSALANNITLASGSSLTNSSGGTLTVNTVNNTAGLAFSGATFTNSGTLNITTFNGHCMTFFGTNTFTANGNCNLVASPSNYALYANATGNTIIKGAGFSLGSISNGAQCGLMNITGTATFKIDTTVSFSEYYNLVTSSNAPLIVGTANFTNNGNIFLSPATSTTFSYEFGIKIINGNGTTTNFNNGGTITYAGNNIGIFITQPSSGVTTAGTLNFTNTGTLQMALAGGTAINANYPFNIAFTNSGTMNLGGTNAILCGTTSSSITSTQTTFTNTGLINISSGGINWNYLPGYSYPLAIANNTNGIINITSATNPVIAYTANSVGTILTNSGGTVSGYCTLANNAASFVSSTGTLSPTANGSSIGTITLPTAYVLTGTFAPQITSMSAYGTIGGNALNLGSASLLVNSSYTPIYAGTEYYITPNTATGNFTSVNFASPTGGWGVDYSTANTNGYGVIYYATPNAPTGVSAIAGNQSATVSFSPPSLGGGVTGYTVTPYIGAIAQATTSGTTSPISISGLTNGIAYTFTVTATNPAGIGTASSPSNSITPNPSPSAPSIVSAIAGDGNTLLFFNIPSSFGLGANSISSYTVTSSGGNSTLTASGSSSPIQVIGLTNGTPYTFTVAATNNLGSTGLASLASSTVTPTIDGGIDSIFSVSAGATLASIGNGTINSSVILYGIASPGGTPSTATLNVGAFSFSTLSSYKLDISNAFGTAGSNSGWDLINSSSAISFPSSGLIVIDLTAPVSGTGFSGFTAYNWTIIRGASISGFNSSNFTILTTNFQPTIKGTFSLVQSGNNINLLYTPFPFINLSGISSSINPFVNQCINTTSTADSFIVTGNYLLGNITITPPSGFQISESVNSGYTTGTISLTPTSGMVSSTKIYLEFIPSESINYSGGSIAVTTSSATTQYVPVSGTGIANNTITLTSSAGTSAQSVFLNSAITNIIYSTTSATGASFSGLPTGISGSWSNNVVTISGTPTTKGTNNYTVTLTGGCGIATASGTISSSSPTDNFTWMGNISSNWSNAANWSNYLLPIATNSITIPSSATFQPVLNTKVTVAGITNSGNLTLNGNLLTINGIISGTGTITGSPASNLVLGGSASGTLYFNQTTTDSTNALDSLNINTSGTVLLGNALHIVGLVTSTSGTLNTGGNLVLLSNNSGTARIDRVIGTISGNVTNQRFIPAKFARKYSFLGSSVSSSIRNSWQQQVYITGSGTGGSICGTTNGDGITSTDRYNTNGFDVTPSNAGSVFTYNATPINGSRWVSIPNTDQTNITPGIGYKINVRGNRNSSNVTCINQLGVASPTPPEAVTLSSTGTLTVGDLSVALNNPSIHSYTLLANPYPSQISFTAFQASNSNINNKMWTYSPFGNNNYTTYSNGIITNGATGYDNTHGDNIAIGQAFFVEANQNGNVTFHETHKVGGTIPNTKYFGSTNNQLIRVGLKTTENVSLDEVVVRFNSFGTKEYNPAWDAYSFNSGTQVLTTNKGSNALAIATLPNSTVSDTAQFGISSNSIGTYRLTFSDFENIDSNKRILLMDKFLNATQDIRVNQQYDFNITANMASQGNNRFEIAFINKAIILPVHFVSVTAQENRGVVTINWTVTNKEGIANYSIERSTDANHFSEIGQAKATGLNNYSIEDFAPSGNTTYYRIIAFASNGSIFYSNTTELVTPYSSCNTFGITPNPVEDKLNITFISAASGKYQVRIITATGLEVINIAEVGVKNNTLTINAGNLASGVYIFEIMDKNGNQQIGKFIKK